MTNPTWHKSGDTKTCAQCGAEFRRRGHDLSNIKWNERKYCSMQCSGAARGKPQVKVCDECGTTFAASGSRGAARRYCGRDCAAAAQTRPVADRLWERVDKSGGPDACWEWQGYRRPLGYGEIGVGKGTAGTHRVAWELNNEPIPDGMFVCHKCDNPPCCNPAHLFLGTNADNVADMLRKGRGARGAMLPQTRLTDEQVAEIRARYDRAAGPPKRGGRASNASELAAEFGISRAYVMQLVHGWYRKEVS